MTPNHDSSMMHTFMTRRRMLQTAGTGFGMLGLTGIMSATGHAAPQISGTGGNLPYLHAIAKAKRVIFLFMNGAPSHVDTFDPKPALAKHEGEQPSEKLYKPSKGSGYMPSPFKFSAHGDGGVVMSELFPNLAQCADDLCVIRSMHTSVPNHEPGLLMMHCGNLQPIRPCLGSWASYGLGTENENLPSFVALCPGRPVVGPQLWSNSFLPGEYQGVAVDTNELDVEKLVANIRNPSLSSAQQRRQLDLLLALNRLHSAQREQEALLEEQIKTMELAFQMQSEAAEAFDISLEPEPIRDLYGETTFGQTCLLARRLK